MVWILARDVSSVQKPKALRGELISSNGPDVCLTFRTKASYGLFCS